MRYYLDGCEVSKKVFDLFLKLESLYYGEQDYSKYTEEQVNQILKYGEQYNVEFKITYDIKKD